jgi:Flp pilus assembly protein TadD/4-amino-4-deoxy-L-arabinose transferase-like glycosyltransferase
MGLRLLYLGHLRTLPFFDHPIMDGAYHDSWAREIAAGQLSRAEPFFRAPLYPFVLGIMYAVSKGSFILPRVFQFVLGGLTSVVVYTLSRRLMNLTAAVIAAALCAVYPVLVYFEGELLTETLFTFLSMLGVLLVDTARRRRAPALWFAGGLALGMAVITRPTIALFLPLVIVGALAYAKPRAAATAALLAGMVLPVAPVTIHNYTVSGEFIPVVWQGGINLYLGNNEAADGWSATSPEIRKDWWGGYRDMIAIPREALGRDPTYGEVSDFWTGKALDFVRSQPLRWSGLMLKKIAIFWSSLEFPNNQDYNFMKIHSWILRNPIVNFGTVAPLSLLGIIVLLRRARRLYFIYAFLLSYFAASIAFFVCARYRSPALPVLCMFAGGAAAYLIGLLKSGRFLRVLLCAGALVPLALVVNVNLTGEHPPDLAQSYTQVGKVYVERGDDASAADCFARAIASNPNWAEAYEQLGLLRMKQQNKQEAERLLLKAVEILPGLASAHRALGMLYLSLGNLSAARVSVSQAIIHAPYLEDSHNILGSIERQEGNREQAISLFRQEIEINPTNWRAYANLAGIYDEDGDSDKAIEAYRQAIELSPGNPDIILALASLYASEGRHDLARSLMESLSAKMPEEINLRYNQAVLLQRDGRNDEAANIYREILREVPYHEGSLVNLGVIYARQGQTGEARQLWLRVLEVNPSHETARRNLELLDE